MLDIKDRQSKWLERQTLVACKREECQNLIQENEREILAVQQQVAEAQLQLEMGASKTSQGVRQGASGRASSETVGRVLASGDQLAQSAMLQRKSSTQPTPESSAPKDGSAAVNVSGAMSSRSGVEESDGEANPVECEGKTQPREGLNLEAAQDFSDAAPEEAPEARTLRELNRRLSKLAAKADALKKKSAVLSQMEQLSGYAVRYPPSALSSARLTEEGLPLETL